MASIYSSREFNQDTSGAKKAALKGPVFITDRGETSFVLMSVDEYRKLVGKEQTIADLLFMPEMADIELDIPDRSSNLSQGADFS
uniref:type II toxin-antitoxin system prevent-host-death family antitoxin n=1 Tax=Cellvibrio fontiphilus TaxID=1815559 RepID=UPI002B4C1DED|nr:type II toxin-antitoxin system prevent-host-death family antitoxin [Cellvibrio fontiphilus]